MNTRLGLVGLLLVVAALVAAPAHAQVYTGRIDVTIEDSTGARAAGRDGRRRGPADQSAVTDAQGEVHFLNLPPGSYTVKAKLSGFTDYL